MLPAPSFRTLLLAALLGLPGAVFGGHPTPAVPAAPAAADPAAPSVQEIIEAGRQKLDHGDAAGAVAEFERLITAHPYDPRGYYARGVARSRLGDSAGAFADYTRTAEIDPHFAPAFTNRGSILWRRGDLESALADFNRAVDADPRGVQALNARGVIKDALGDQIGARTDYGRAIEVNPEFLESYGNRGQSYILSRNWDAALADFRRAFASGIANQDYLRLFSWLVRMRLGNAELANGELSAYLTKRGEATDWYATVAQYLLGKMSKEELIAAAGSPDRDRQKWCEVWYYTGMKSLLNGEQPAAIEELQKCVATGMRSASEYLFAQSELKAMEKKEETKRKKEESGPADAEALKTKE